MTDGRLRSLLFAAALLGAAGCAFAPPEEADEVFRAGIEQAKSGAVDRALKTLRDGVAAYPGHTRMRFELARLQYETGEPHHVLERQAIQDAVALAERGDRERSGAHRRQAETHRGRALPHYRAARENLRVVVDAERDAERLAWANFLLLRVAVFFEDWEEALEASEEAIEQGRLSGARLAQWREYQSGLRDKLGRAVDE